MNKRLLCIIGLIVLLSLAGCMSEGSPGRNDAVDTDEEELIVSGDSEAEVVCFLSSHSVESGIDCSPVSETGYDSISEVPSDEEIVRVVKPDAEMVCYRSSHSVSAGVDCLPLNATDLS